MSHGNIAPYRRSKFAGEGHTGSLVFDQHRQGNLREGDTGEHPAPAGKGKADRKKRH